MGDDDFKRKRKLPLVEALEPRILFSVDAFGGALEAAATSDPLSDTLEKTKLEYDKLISEKQTLALQNKDSDSSEDQAIKESDIYTSLPSDDEGVRKELVVVDTGTPDYLDLLDDLLAQKDDGRQIDVVMIDADQDGIAQLSKILTSYSELDAVHLISHGSDGAVVLGNTILDNNALLNNQKQIATWGGAFGEAGDFLIYGCNLAQTESGELLIGSLSQLTNTDIAASSDLTGNAALGGDWDLEYSVGAIEADLVVSDDAQLTYSGVLTTPTSLSSGIELNADDGNDAYLISNAGLSQSLSETTVEIQFAANATPNETVFISFNNTTGDEFSIQTNHPGNTLELDFGNGAEVNAGAIDYTSILDGQLHSLAVTWDNTNGDWSIYIDGEFIESGTGLNVGNSLDTTNGQFVFGQEQDSQDSGYDPTQYFSGSYFDVRIWSEARSEAEIALNYQHKFDTGSLPSSLVANWQMDGFNGSNQVVDVVSGNDLSIAHASITTATDINSWSNASTGVTASGNTLTFVDDSAAAGWSSQINSPILSSLGFTDDYTVSFNIDDMQNNAYTVGLGIADSDQSQGDVDYAMYFDAGFSGAVRILQNGSTITNVSVAYQAGDQFSFYVDGSNIHYQHNGSTFYTATGVTVAENWYIDTSFFAATVGGYANQQDYSLSNFQLSDGNFEVYTSSTPITDLAIDENSANDTRVGFVVPTGSDTSEDIVSDGLFQNASNPGYSAAYSAGNTFGDWTVRTGSIDLVGTKLESSPLGGWSVELNEGGTTGGIYQTLSTEVGKQYQVVFSYSGNWFAGEAIKDFRVSAAGSSQDFSVSQPAGWSGSNMLWSQGAFTFVAGSTSTDLDFLSLDSLTTTGPVIADIQVVEVPSAVSIILANDPSLNYDAATGKFYKFVGSTETWTNASSLAQAAEVNGISGQLATIQSAYENEVVRNVISTAGWGTAWIGGSDQNSEGEFHWYENGNQADQFWTGGQAGSATAGSYENFRSGEPFDLGGQDYTLLFTSDGAWDDAADSDISAYVIEWDASQVLSNFTFSLTDDAAGRFAIDSNSGEVIVADGSQLNFEANQSHNITVEVTDAAGSTYSEVMSVAVNNLAETTQVLPAAQSVDEDGTLTFNIANGNAVSVSDTLAGTNSKIQVTLSVNDGVIKLSQLTGITIVAGADNSASITFNGTESDINAALEGMTFDPDMDFNGAMTLNVSTSLAANLDGHYTFEGGNANDQSVGTAQDGTLNGNATTVIDGTRGEVLSLDGSGDYVEMSTNFGQPTDVTLAAWVNFSSAAANSGEVISITNVVALRVDDPSHGVTGFFYNGSTFDFISTGPSISLADDAWHHVAFSFDDVNNTQSLYIDGQLVASANFTASISYPGWFPQTTIGSHADLADANYDFNGRIDDARVYTRALSGDEIEALATDQATVSGNVAITINSTNAAPEFGIGDGLEVNNIASLYDSAVDMVIQPDGKYVILTSANTATTGQDIDFALTRYNVDGTLDTSFGSGGTVITAVNANNESPTAIALQADGKIVVTGSYTPSGSSDGVVIRYDTNGLLDTTFDSDGIKEISFPGASNDTFTDIAVLADGSIVVAGYANIAGVEEMIVARLDTNGTLDSSFDSDGLLTLGVSVNDDRVNSMVIQSDGKIVLVGQAHNGTNNDITVIRVNTNGTLDGGFGTAGILTVDAGPILSLSSANDYGQGVAIDSSGRMIVIGTTSASGSGDTFVIRVNSDGTLDGTFGTAGLVTVAVGSPFEAANDVAIQADGKIVVVGDAYNGSNNDVSIIRLNDNGTLDTTFDDDGLVRSNLNGATDSAAAVKINSDGAIVVAGRTDVGGSGDSFVAKYNADGSLHERFGVLVNTLDGNPTFVEGGTAVLLDSDVQIFDEELSAIDDFNGASLTLVRDGGANADDVFSATGSLVLNAGTIELSSINIGAYTNSGGTLVMTFAVSTTNAQVNEVMQSIAYQNTNDAPPSSVQVNWTFDDGGDSVTTQGGSAEQAVGSTIVNITSTNDAPVIGGVDTGSVTEDIDPDTDTLLETVGALTIVDPDAGESSFVAGTINGTYGDLIIDSAGNWSYVADNTQAAIQQLDAGESINDVIAVTTADGSIHNVTVTINGAEDAPIIGGTASGTVAEDGALMVGDSLSITDVDTNDNPVSFNDQTPIAGDNGYGTFTMVGNDWTYTLNNTHAAVQALDVGESLDDTFTFTASDGSTQLVTITINGAEDAPTVDNPITNQVATEDSPFSFAFNNNTFGDVDTSDTLTYSAQLSGGGSLPSWLSFDANTRTFSGTPLNADVGVISVDVIADDGSTTVTDVFSLTVNNTNDAPVIDGVDTGAVIEDIDPDTDALLEASGALTIADPDVGESSFVSGTLNGTYGDLTIDTSGNWNYAADNTQAAIQQLDVGESINDVIAVTTADGSTHNVTITINGAEDAPVISGINADSVAEDGSLIANGSLTINDVDTNDNPISFNDQATIAGNNGYGTFEMTGGTWTYTLNNAHAAVQALDVTESLTDTFTFSANDGTTIIATVTINGAEDAPTVDNVIPNQVATEDSSFSFTFNSNTFGDVDISDTLTYTAQLNGGSPLPGWLNFDVMTRTFSGTPLNADVGAISIDVIADDGSSIITDTFTLTVNNTNDAPVIGGVDTGSVTEDIDPDTDTLLETVGALTIVDPDVGESSFVAGTINGTYGDLIIDSAGSWSYVADNTQVAVQSLDVGESLNDVIVVTTADGSTHNVTITISGAEDASIIGGTASGTVAEDGALIVGDSLSITDVDTTDNPVSFNNQTPAAGSSGYGAFAMVGNDWTYTLNNTHVAVQALDVGESLNDTFTFTASDGSTQLVTITINGAEDAPTVDNPIINQVATEDSPFSFAFNDNTFGDVDTSDTLTYSAQLSGGGSLPGWLSFDANARTFSGTPLNVDVGAISIDVIADDGSSIITDTFTLTVNNTNDAPVIGGVDTGSVTEDIDPDTDTLLETVGALTIVDPDVGESSFVAGTINGTYGDLIIDSAGNWSYAADNTQSVIQQLDAGESINDVIAVTTADGSIHNVTVTINGAEDAPIIGGTNSGAVAEDGALMVGDSLSITDVDTNDNPVSFNDQTPIAGDNGYGTFTMVGNDWTYTLNNTHAAVQALDIGESLTDTFIFTGSDGSTQLVTVTINGAEDAPTVDNVIPNQVATEDSSFSFTFNSNTFGDVDISDTLTYTAQLNGGSPLPGWLNFDAMTRTFSGTPLNADVGAISIDVIADDGSTTIADTFTLTVNNTNDAPVIGGVDTGSVIEDIDPDMDTLLETVGALTIADPDVGESSFVAGTINGTYGDLIIDSAGSWSYVADNTQVAVQSLDVGESLNDVIVVTTADGSTHNVTVTINGAEDASVIAGVNMGVVSEDGALLASDNLTITDVDTNDNPLSFNDQTSTASDNGYGTFVMTGNTWTYSLDNSHVAVQALDVSETLTDTFTFTATDGSTQTVTVTIYGESDQTMLTDPDPIDNTPPVTNPVDPVENDSPDEGEDSSPSIELLNPSFEPSSVDKLLFETDLGRQVNYIAPLDIAEIDELIVNDFSDKKAKVPLKYLDLLNLEVSPVRLDLLDPFMDIALIDNEQFTENLDLIRKDIDRAIELDEAEYAVGAEVRLGLVASLSAGFISWVLRAGTLLASSFSVMPIWRQLDPLPVIGTEEDNIEKIDEEQEDTVPANEQGAVAENFFRQDNLNK